jgi:hypothetical protein
MLRTMLRLTFPGVVLLLGGCGPDGSIADPSPTSVQLAKGAKPKVDQSNRVSDPAGLGVCNGLYGQTFVPQAKEVSQVDLLITVNQIGAGGDPTTVGVYSDITQSPIATTSVTVGPAAPGELSRVVSYVFANPVPVQKGTTYTIGWTGVTSCWQFSFGDAYPQGTAVLFDGSALNPPADFWFVTYSR